MTLQWIRTQEDEHRYNGAKQQETIIFFKNVSNLGGAFFCYNINKNGGTSLMIWSIIDFHINDLVLPPNTSQLISTWLSRHNCIFFLRICEHYAAQYSARPGASWNAGSQMFHMTSALEKCINLGYGIIIIWQRSFGQTFKHSMSRCQGFYTDDVESIIPTNSWTSCCFRSYG